MSDRSLRDAITTVVNRELARVSDRILRLEVSKDWPVADALVDLDKITRVRVLVQRPFKLNLVGQERLKMLARRLLGGMTRVAIMLW
jgi:hypothetical protein